MCVPSWSMALLDLVFSFSFLVPISLFVSTHFSLRVVLEGATTSLAHQGGEPQPGSFKDRFKPSVFCTNDVAFLKPTSVGRDVVDVYIQTSKVSCVVCICGSTRCKTCMHMSQGSTFTSNVTKKMAISSNPSMDCSKHNVIYLISCKRCGIQYVGETSQKLRCRLNNHRNRLRKLPNLYLHQHFSSDGHFEDDIIIMPMEEVTSTCSDRGSLNAKRLEREEYWCRELCTIYIHMV